MLKQEQPYNHDSTASRLLSEVKHDLARLVLRWGTTLESLVLFFCSFPLSCICCCSGAGSTPLGEVINSWSWITNLKRQNSVFSSCSAALFFFWSLHPTPIPSNLLLADSIQDLHSICVQRMKLPILDDTHKTLKLSHRTNHLPTHTRNSQICPPGEIIWTHDRTTSHSHTHLFSPNYLEPLKPSSTHLMGVIQLYYIYCIL